MYHTTFAPDAPEEIHQPTISSDMQPNHFVLTLPIQSSQVATFDLVTTHPFRCISQPDHAVYRAMFSPGASGETYQTVNSDMQPNCHIPTLPIQSLHPASTPQEQGPHTSQPMAPNHLMNSSTFATSAARETDQTISWDTQLNHPIPTFRPLPLGRGAHAMTHRAISGSSW